MAQAATFDQNVLVHDQRVKGQTPNYLAKDGNIIWTDADTPIEWVIDTIVGIANSIHTTNKIVNLYLIAHGVYERRSLFEFSETSPGTYEGKFVSKCGPYYGGAGLEIGKEGINLLNLNILDKLKDKVGKIIVYSCSSAGGRIFMESKTVPKSYFTRLSDWIWNRASFGVKEETILIIKKDPELIGALELTCSTSTNNAERLRGIVAKNVTEVPQSHQLLTEICKRTNAVVFGANDPQTYYTQTNMIHMGNWEGELFQYDPPTGVPQLIIRPGNDYF